MGKRKSARKPVAKTKIRLDSVFDCLFCNHEKTVSVKMDNESKVGHIHCSVCPASYQAPINYLSDPIDVYSDWIDACENANSGPGAQAASRSSGGGAAGRGPPSLASRPGRPAPRRVDSYGVPDELDDAEDDFE
ncbi:hypothetical protein IWQ60_003671 [Tieghemiomyces parasiticus]|uniref:Transcription elongation factor 1 homolog n=1 Tax=Tieghemiomyces parasiticus TaxID=78921 RepID=A0A9W8A611_9FUNG|nr:hypothetical protein IWQ60_006683 [Tieghemiomyces parasiticus]KAJ1926591.1 hypothetical protein IWQ60_003671 [Tieghemiomyces parasiticus]